MEYQFKKGDNWTTVPIENSDFEVEISGANKKNFQWRTRGNGYEFATENSVHYEGEKSLSIQFVGDGEEVKGKPVFDDRPEFGEIVDKKISQNIVCQIPVVLYGDEKSTFPTGNKDDLNLLEKKLENAPHEPTALAFRLGNVINTYNVFQHFYPYFDVVDVDWDAALEEALERSFTDNTAEDHLVTLQKLTAVLKDGHIRVSNVVSQNFSPPISWEWVEDKLIITHLFDDSSGLKIGDEVTQIDGQNAEDYFSEVKSRISAGTKGWLDYRAKNASLFGPENSKLVLTVDGNEIELIRDMDFYKERRPSLPKRDFHKEINDRVYYLNLDSAPMDTINELIPKLENYESIICDLRGYPNGNHDFIRHLMKAKDTTEAWMQVPEIVYPDQRKITGYWTTEWKMNTKKPYLGDKQIVFITDGSAISYAESYMGYVEGYDLATIVGQPTAGTNGNINPFNLPGGYRINWTGMKVVKHDGSQHHGVGILPDVYIEKTIDGIKSGKDEFLERAIELTKRK